MPGAIDLTGQKFSRLTAKFRLPENDKYGQARWHCECECGNTTSVTTSNLRNKRIHSCGCLAIESANAVNVTHGLSTSAEYHVWQEMKQRCHNENHHAYADYGGRGIAVCDEWKESFETFYRDMGPRPGKKYALERRDNDKGYSKENCVWATMTQQARNRRNNIYYELDGKTKTLGEWCHDLSLPYCAIYMRMKRGASFEDAIADFVCS